MNDSRPSTAARVRSVSPSGRRSGGKQGSSGLGAEADGAEPVDDADIALARTPRPVERLGARIREHRVARGIGVRELARQVDCSASMISQIEAGTTNPSVSTLYAISNALQISTDILISGAPYESDTSHPKSVAGRKPDIADMPRSTPSVVLHPANRRVINLDSGVCWELLMPHPEANAEFMEVTYDVDGGSTPDDRAIRHNGREYALILEGALSVQIGFERYLLEVGDSMAFDSTIPHRFWNAGTVPVRAVWFVSDRLNFPDRPQL